MLKADEAEPLVEGRRFLALGVDNNHDRRHLRCHIPSPPQCVYQQPPCEPPPLIAAVYGEASEKNTGYIRIARELFGQGLRQLLKSKGGSTQGIVPDNYLLRLIKQHEAARNIPPLILAGLPLEIAVECLIST